MSIFRQDESMSIFTLIPGVTPDDWDDYESGCNDQRDRCEHEARVLTFGAIRRAVRIARESDRLWNATSLPAPRAASLEIRRAIRAAIGSDKS